MNETPDLIFSQCVTCRQCCKNVPTLVIPYPLLKKIPELLSPALISRAIVVYSIKERDIDRAAKTWRHLPEKSKNLLKSITNSIEGKYNIAVLAKTRGTCVFLGPHGCVLTEEKPLQCRHFPFYLEEGTLHRSEWCDYINEISEDKDIEHKVKQIYKFFDSEYKHYAGIYAETLEDIIGRFGLRIIDFR